MPAEEVQAKIQELLPEGITVTADAAALHEAATTSGRGDEDRSVLDQASP